MKVFLTGGTGFIGAEVARLLRARGDDVVALVRNPDRAGRLEDDGCRLVRGSLSDRASLAIGIDGCDAVVHCAALYEVGVNAGRCAEMYEANVRGTQSVLRAALDAHTPKVVYVSTVNAFGNTQGHVVDEDYVRAPEYVSCYDETKHLAHKLARRMIGDQSLPCVIAMPGVTYGPGDHSEFGKLVERFLRGRLPLLPFPNLGATFAYVEDVAAGIILLLDKGRVGEQYVLGGEIATVEDVIGRLAVIAGRPAPHAAVPVWLMKASAPLGRVVGPALGFPPNLREAVRAFDGVTYWARHDKASEELGYDPRPLDRGLRDLVEARRAGARQAS